jgi:hypothetical protein
VDWKYRLGKLTSLLLIGIGVYQIIYSTFLLVLVYPHLNFEQGYSGMLLYESLIEKALVYYASMIISGIYGISLLFKSREKLTYLQIVGGLFVFGLNVFFVTKTQVTTDPFVDLFLKIISQFTR